VELNDKPINFKLGWKEQYIYVLFETKKKNAMKIFDYEDLTLKHSEVGLPTGFQNLYLISPLYNQYFKKKLKIFEKTYQVVFNSFKQFNEIYQESTHSGENFEEIDKKHSKVFLTSFKLK
jgi:hypothetical protein